MKQIVLALLLLLFGAATANAQLVTDTAFGVAYNAAELKLDYLPQDQGKLYVSVFGTGERFEQVKRWFDTNPEMKRLKDESHFAAIDTASEMFRSRYAACTSAALTLRIQNPDGTVVQELTDGQIPMSAEACIRQTNECFRRRQTTPPPVDPPPGPLPPPAPNKPIKRPTPVWPSIALVTLAGLVGFGLGVREMWRKTHA